MPPREFAQRTAAEGALALDLGTSGLATTVDLPLLAYVQMTICSARSLKCSTPHCVGQSAYANDCCYERCFSQRRGRR